MAIDIVSFPMKMVDLSICYVNVYQMVNLHFLMVFHDFPVFFSFSHRFSTHSPSPVFPPARHLLARSHAVIVAAKATTSGRGSTCSHWVGWKRDIWLMVEPTPSEKISKSTINHFISQPLYMYIYIYNYIYI